MDFALVASACRPAPAAAAADVTAHLPVLLLGLKWLYDTTQPPGSVQHPGGDALPSAGARVLTFVPSGPNGWGALRIDTTEPENPVTPAELAAFVDLLDGMGEVVVSMSTDAGGNLCVLARRCTQQCGPRSLAIRPGARCTATTQSAGARRTPTHRR